MTYCIHGTDRHRFPYEDRSGAYCEEHGVTLWHGPSVTAADLLTRSAATGEEEPHGSPEQPAPGDEE